VAWLCKVGQVRGHMSVEHVVQHNVSLLVVAVVGVVGVVRVACLPVVAVDCRLN